MFPDKIDVRKADWTSWLRSQHTHSPTQYDYPISGTTGATVPSHGKKQFESKKDSKTTLLDHGSKGTKASETGHEQSNAQGVETKEVIRSR